MLFSNRAIFLRNAIPRGWLKKFKTISRTTINSIIVNYTAWRSFTMGRPLLTNTGYFHTGAQATFTDNSNYGVRVSNDSRFTINFSFYISSDLFNTANINFNTVYSHSWQYQMINASVNFDDYAGPRTDGSTPNGVNSYSKAIGFTLSPGNVGSTESRAYIGFTPEEVQDQWCTFTASVSPDYTDFANWAGPTDGAPYARLTITTQSGLTFSTDEARSNNYAEGDSFSNMYWNGDFASGSHQIRILNSSLNNGESFKITNLWIAEGATLDPSVYHTEFHRRGLPVDCGSTVGGVTSTLRLPFKDTTATSMVGGQILFTSASGITVLSSTDFLSAPVESELAELYQENPYSFNWP